MAAAEADPEQARGLIQNENPEPAATNCAKERGNDAQRAMDYIRQLRDLPEDSPIKKGIACFLKYGVKPLLCIATVYVKIFKALYVVYTYLPMTILQMIFGITLCFFGGCYLMVLAAVEAFRNMGGQRFIDDMTVLWEQGNLVADASKKDDEVDADKNGVADVQEMSQNDYFNHKAKVAMIAVTEPQRLQMAVGNLWAAYMSVLAVLRLQFAQTIAIALGIAEMLELPIVRFVGPYLAYAMGPELNHWVHTIISTTVKITAMAVAWYMQTVISAFYSAIRGGKLFATALFQFFTDRGWLEKFPDSLVKKPFNPDESYLDEAIGYPLAAIGFYVQYTYDFGLHFPLNLILFPLTCIEWIIRWQVTWG